ncbi:MAG: Hsp20/alpha crystallin family protein [Lachnospiraceae bacterium]|nr:Hsp20/alpha crystallin family protein [Lachnospiraceae bacterium]
MLMSSILGESLFEELFDEFTRPVKSVSNYTTPAVMRTDVKESETGYEIHIELPGYKKEDVRAELKDGNLTINATKNVENDKQDENGKYIRRERFYGNCSRSFYVGEEVEQTDIKAKFEDGILKVFVPKKDKKPAIEEKKYILIEG